MRYNYIGTSDLSASVAGFGCMSLSKAPKQQAAVLVEAAVQAGINYFDTADLYDKGENEKLIGQLLKPVRNKVIIASKVGNEWKKDGSGWDWNPRKSYILKAVEGSLKRLQTDHIDMYQLHGGTLDDPIEETIEAFELLVQQGKIRYYGISSIRPNVIRKYVSLSNIQSVMMQYSLLDRRPEEAALHLIKENTISVLARGVLAQGLLIDKPAKDYLGYTAGEIAGVRKQLLPQETEGYSSTGIALQYVLSNAAVASAVIGFRTVEQLNDVLDGLDNPIPATIIENLRQWVPAKKYTDHR
ncbi:MAG: aldo/keto reductase [Niabella sp.]